MNNDSYKARVSSSILAKPASTWSDGPKGGGQGGVRGVGGGRSVEADSPSGTE